MFDPPIERAELDPFEQAARDRDQAAFLAALIPALIILAAAIALIFVVGP